MSDHIESHSEREILKACIELMQGAVSAVYELMGNMGVSIDDIRDSYGDEIDSIYTINYFTLVQRLFLWESHHSGGTSTRQKCKELGVDYCDDIKFAPWEDDEEDEDDE